MTHDPSAFDENGIDPEETEQNCHQCGKQIPDDEWVVNWGSCSDCFDYDYKVYLQTGNDPCDDWSRGWSADLNEFTEDQDW